MKKEVVPIVRQEEIPGRCCVMILQDGTVVVEYSLIEFMIGKGEPWEQGSDRIYLHCTKSRKKALSGWPDRPTDGPTVWLKINAPQQLEKSVLRQKGQPRERNDGSSPVRSESGSFLDASVRLTDLIIHYFDKWLLVWISDRLNSFKIYVQIQRKVVSSLIIECWN